MKYVVFKVAGREYALTISQVREVIRMRKIIPVPDAADFVVGVISLRGKVVAVVHLRRKLKLATKDFEASDRILITHLSGHYFGIIVDEVVDVLPIESGQIVPPDDFLKDAEYLTGVGKIQDRLILLIDAEKLFHESDQQRIKAIRERVEIKKKG